MSSLQTAIFPKTALDQRFLICTFFLSLLVYAPMLQVNIEKLVAGGTGLGKIDTSTDFSSEVQARRGLSTSGKAIFVWNALPDEEVEVEILKNKKDFAEGVATRILRPSAHRQPPTEAHFLSSCPWQIMNFSYENEWKRKIAAEQYSKIGDLIISPDELEIITDGKEKGYRNKIEFSFTEIANNHENNNGNNTNKVSLAFFERGKKVLVPVNGSSLAEPIINEVAEQILEWVNAVKIPIRSLKSLIVRSNGQGQAVAALFIKDKLKFTAYPTLDEHLLGFHVYYSTHKSPASVPTELLYQSGQDYLVADILGTRLKFGLLSFFQINIPVFILALKDIAAFLDPHVPVVDFYCGVGAISLSLSHSREKTELIESNAEAVQYADENVKFNHLQNCTTECAPAEKMVAKIASNKTIIVDPPRAGLHERVITALLHKLPPRLIYLSCDLATQARDMRLLSSHYKVTFLKLYNFFPRTPHIEGLVVMDRVSGLKSGAT